jgi:hypothetical protein
VRNFCVISQTCPSDGALSQWLVYKYTRDYESLWVLILLFIKVFR